MESQAVFLVVIFCYLMWSVMVRSIFPRERNMIEYGSPDACSIADHKSGRKGC